MVHLLSLENCQLMETVFSWGSSGRISEFEVTNAKLEKLNKWKMMCMIQLLMKSKN